MLEHSEHLARMAHRETGLGRYEDKVVKNRVVAPVPGPRTWISRHMATPR
jgi:hypothetical protein